MYKWGLQQNAAVWNTWVQGASYALFQDRPLSRSLPSTTSVEAFHAYGACSVLTGLFCGSSLSLKGFFLKFFLNNNNWNLLGFPKYLSSLWMVL